MRTNLEYQSVNKLFEDSIKANWWRPALSNYQGDTMSFAKMAERIKILQITFERCNLKKGDKVAICGRNQANWGVCFLAALTYGAVPVPLLHEFSPESIVYLLDHSEAKVFFVDEFIWEKLDKEKVSGVTAIVRISDFEFLQARYKSMERIRESVITEYHRHFPLGLKPENLDFYPDSPDELAMINYTSGTSGFSKGVMIPYRALWCNLRFSFKDAEPQMGAGTELVAMLPSAHMYGLMFEFLHSIAVGTHVHYLTRVPSPKIVLGAIKEIKPDLVIAVPLIIEKIYKNHLKQVVDKTKWFINLPFFGGIVRRAIRQKLINSFGGRFEEIILGGAALNPEVDSFFRKIKFRYTVGYGMTETAPIITYVHWNRTKKGSCGKPIKGCSIRIDSPDPVKIPGEVQVKGDNVFLGYYKNEEATTAAFTSDGWFKTGDMGVINKKGYLYLRGRCKCMLLSSNGQNIYPEELEAVINNFDYVVDSLVVQRKEGIVALIYPDFKQALLDGIERTEFEAKIASLIPQINRLLPVYAQIRRIEVRQEDFERTPKQSIKRYLYQDEKQI